MTCCRRCDHAGRTVPATVTILAYDGGREYRETPLCQRCRELLGEWWRLIYGREPTRDSEAVIRAIED